MIDFIKRFFSPADQPAPQPEAQDVTTAACALFIALSEVDGEVAPEETETILDILQQHYGLSPDRAQALLAEAQTVSAHRIDLWQLTNRINVRCSKAEKLDIVEMMWRVVYADGRLDDHEHHMMSRVPDLLRLERSLVIERKLKARSVRG